MMHPKSSAKNRDMFTALATLAGSLLAAALATWGAVSDARKPHVRVRHECTRLEMPTPASWGVPTWPMISVSVLVMKGSTQEARKMGQARPVVQIM